MPEDFVMPPDPHSGGGLDFGGFNQTGPLNLTYLTKPKQKQVVPYDQRLEEYTAGGGKKATNPWQRGGRAGFLGGFAGDMGFFETISDILPYDPGKEWFKGIGDALEEEAYEVPMRTLRDIKGAGDFMDYMGQGIGYVFGYVGSMIPTALATGGLGAAGRIVGREALKGLTKKQIGARGAQAVGRFVTGPSIIKNTGHIYRGVREETGVESPAIAIPAGIASGMLERFGMGKTFGTFFETIPFNAKQQVWRQMVANAMRGYGRAWAIEGATETGQELIQLAANEVADSTYDLVTSENAWRVLDAAALGAFGSGPFGAIGSAGNYYGQKVSAEKDKKLVDEVIRRVQNIAPEGSQIMFRMGQQRIKEQAALLGDEEFIPTDSHVETLERVVDQIQEQKSLSEEQKAALLADATNVLGRFRERFATQEATKAEESSDVEVAARDNREAAEQVAGVPSQQMVEPESAILPENQAPYNNPESRYNIGQEYKHRLDTVEGEAIQVDAVVTKIGKDGRVLESVSADENRLPLIVTKGKKTISLHTQEDVLNVMKELDADKFGRPEPKSAAESSLAMVQLLDAQEKRKVSREVAEEAGAEIETDEIIPATELIKRRKAREASVAAKKAGKPPLQAAKAVAKAVRTVYAAKPAPTAKVGREEMDRINLENKRKTILKSKVVEVSRPGEKRRTGVITEVKLLQHFSEAVGGPRMFSAEVHWDDGEIETVSIDENFESSQPLYGGLMVVAKNGKLSKEQESAISNVEKKVIPAVDPEAEEVAEVQVPPPTEKPRATKETTKAPTKPQPTKEVEVTKRIVKGEKPEVKPEEVAGLSSEETLLLKAINTEVTKRTIGVRDTGAGAVTTVDEATGELLLDGLSEAEIKGEQYQLANRGMRVDAVKMLVENTGWLFDARRQELGLTKIAAENIKIIEALKKKVGEQKPVILGNLKLDKDLSARMRQMRNDRAEEDKMQMTIETFIVRSFVELGRLIETATIYIRQLYRNGKVKSGEKFNRETRGYKAVRDRFIKDLSIDLEERLPQDALMPHLPSFGEDPVKFLGGLFDAVVEEYNKVDGVRGLSSMEDGGVNQDKARELEGLILDKDTLSKYLDYPIAEDTDDERTIVIANSNIFKKTDTGWDINNIELYSDDLSKQYIPVMDFSDHKGLSVTIKSVGKGMDAIAYRLSEEALKRVRFQESKTSGREGKVTFAHIPESLLIENGNVQYDNWVLDTQKAGGRFLKDISWVGLPTEEFVRLLKLRTKNKELKAFLKSKKGGLLLSSKEEVAATIANAILLASDPRYKPSNKKAKTAKKALAEKKDSKVALFSVDQLQKLLEHAINIHLDHFATLTEKQLGLLTPELTELNRLTAYHNKLFRAYHEKSIPRALDLPKLDANLEPKADTSLDMRGLALWITNDPDVLKGRKPNKGMFISRLKELFYSFEEKKEGLPKALKRKTLRPEDLKEAKDTLEKVSARMDELRLKVSQVKESAVLSEDDLVNLEATIRPAEARMGLRMVEKTAVGDVEFIAEGEVEEEYELDPYVKDRGATVRVGPTRKIVENIRNFFKKGTGLGDAYSAIVLYTDGVEREKEKFTAEYRSTLLIDEAKERDPVKEAEAKIALETEKGVATPIAEGEDPSKQVIAKEREAELDRLLEGKFDEDTELGRAIKGFRAARTKLVDLIEHGSEEDPAYGAKLLEYQLNMLTEWDTFMAKQGTDFVLSLRPNIMGQPSLDYKLMPRTAGLLEVYKDIESENISRVKARGIFESIDAKIERVKARFNDAESERLALRDSYDAAVKRVDAILEPIRKQTQAFINSEHAKGPEERKFLAGLGWVGPRGGRKQLTPQDVTIHKVITHPEKYAGESGAIREKLEEEKPIVDGYLHAVALRDGLALNLSLFEEELAYIYGGALRFKASDVPGIGFEPVEGESWLKAPDFERLRAKEKKLEVDIEEYKREGLKVEATKARKERATINKILSFWRSESRKRGKVKEYRLTAQKLKKREVVFQVIFDSHIQGGARRLPVGNLFGHLVSISNKFSEDQFRETGKPIQVEVAGYRMETPASLYYKLYKTLELRDPKKILSHPIFSNSGMYIGPIKPEGMTEERWIDSRFKRTEKIGSEIQKYIDNHSVEQHEASLLYIKDTILASIVNDFISIFTYEAGYRGNKEAIVKKAMGVSGKLSEITEHLSEGLRIPFKPLLEEDIDPSITEEALTDLGNQLGVAKEKFNKALEVFEKNKGALDVARLSYRNVVVSRTGKTDIEQPSELGKLVVFAEQTKAKYHAAKTELDKITLQIEAIKADPRILFKSEISSSSLDIIPNKNLSTTITMTLPFGYSSVKADRKSIDLEIKPMPLDGKLAEGDTSGGKGSVEIGRSKGSDEIAQLLHENRARLGDAFVDRSLSFLSQIPDKYLDELTLSMYGGGLETIKGTKLSGSFMEAIKTVFIPTEGNTTDSFVHEFSHYLHAFLPAEQQERVTHMRKDALQKVVSNTKDGRLRYRIEMASVFLVDADSDMAMGPDDFQFYLDKYGDKAKDMYHLMNDREFFAYIMTKEGQRDIGTLSPNSNPVGFVAKIKQFFADFINWVLKKSGLVVGEAAFVDEVLSKFKSGSFTVERRMFTAGPAVDASILTVSDLKRALEFNVRNAALTEGGGANVEAGRQVSMEAGSFHNMIYDLSNKFLMEMSESDEFRNLLTGQDDEVSISKRAAGLANIKESSAIRRLLEDNEISSGGVIFSPEGYLQLLKVKKTLKDKDKIPDSMWQQVSKEFFKNTEEFLESYRRLLAKADAVKGENQNEKLKRLLSEVKEQYDSKTAAASSAASFKGMIRSMLEKANERSAENEAIKRLTQYGFDLNQITSQLDDKLIGGEINKMIRDFYNTVWFSAEAQMILHKGINKDGKKATWEDLMWTYIVEKGIELKHRKRRVGMSADDRRNMMFAEVEPIMKFAADHILKVHQNDMLLNEVSEKQLEASFNEYTKYEAEINALFETNTITTKAGKLQKVDGAKRAVDRLLKDYKQAVGDQAIANRLYLSLRRNVHSQIRYMNDVTVAAELVGRIVESKEFSDARNAAAAEIEAKPDREMSIDTAKITFIHPEKGEDFEFYYDVSDKTGRENQLRKLSIYVESLNKWLADNPESPYTDFWLEMRDYASATMLSPTMRGGQAMKPVVNVNALRPIQNMMAGIGTYTSRLSMTHMDNMVAMMERSADIKDMYEQKVVNALQAAAKSHGFSTDPIGIDDWFTAIGERFFATANQTGRKLNVGDRVTMSDLTDIKTVTKEDEAAIKIQVEFTGALFQMDVKQGRGDLILRRRTEEELRKRGGKAGRIIGRKALQVTPWTLPKTFSSKAIRFSQSISAMLREHKDAVSDIDADTTLSDSQKRELKLGFFKAADRRGDSVMSLIGENFNRFVLAFVDNREGRITNGTNPFFTEGVYDEARDSMVKGEIRNLDELAEFFSNRSVDITKLGQEGVPMQLSKKEALYELLREMSTQSDKFHDFIYGKIDHDTETSLAYKFAKLKKDSPFTVARQEPIANYYYYNYGISETVGLHNLSLESSAQYIDAFRASLDAVEGELDAASNDKKLAAERGNLEEFMEGKKQSAANRESFLDYERVEAHKANVKALMNDIDAVRDRDIRYELQVNRTFRRVFGDMISVAIQAPTTALVNLIGTPVRTTMRMQAMFGFAPKLNARFVIDALKEMTKGAATFGRGFIKGAWGGLGYLAIAKPKKALIKFVDEFANKPFTEDFVIGQYKVNSTLRRIFDAGYGMRIDVQGKIDAYWDSVETRGRVERALELRGRGAHRSFWSKLYNGSALILAEIPGTTLPRLFDAVGNNVSFRFANTAMSHLELRLKDLHRKYGDSLWERYNDPDVLAKDTNKMDTLTPVDAFGEQFLFSPDESKLGKLENMFMHAGLDFHQEAFRFYKALNTDKEATFLTPEQRAQMGIGLVTSENLATIANRPLKFRNDPNVGFLFALSGWSLSAAHNSVEFLSKAQGGKQGWSVNSLNVQLGMVMLGMMAVAGVAFAGQEELMRKIYRFMFGEVRVGRHPWEADSAGEAARRTLLYALSGFPIVNTPFNMMLNDQKNMASMGMDLFIQNKVRDVINLAGQLASTRNLEGAERALLVWTKQTYPNSRMLVNAFPSISGTIDLMNNKRLIQRHSPRDIIKVSSYSGGATTATPLTGIIGKMSSYATQGRFDEFMELYRKAVRVARELGRPDPERYVRTLYFGKDPYRAALKGRITEGVRTRVLNSLDPLERSEFLNVERNFYKGLRMIGGSPRSFGVGAYIPRRRSYRRTGKPFPTGMKSASPLRKTYAL